MHIAHCTAALTLHRRTTTGQDTTASATQYKRTIGIRKITVTAAHVYNNNSFFSQQNHYWSGGTAT
jgi:hypothetical protein